MDVPGASHIAKPNQGWVWLALNQAFIWLGVLPNPIVSGSR